MLSIKTSIISVNYGESLYNMLPAAIERCRNMEQGSGMLRFIQELNNKSLDNLLKFLDCLPRELYNQLLYIIVKLYNNEITSMVNNMVKSQEFGSSININGIFLDREPGGNLALYINNIEADYGSLICYAKDKGFVDKIIQNISTGKLPRGIVTLVLKTITSMLSGMPSQKLESKLLFLLKQDFIKKKLADNIEKFLLGKGVVIKLGSLELLQSEAIPPKIEGLGEMEEKLSDMLVSWIKPLL